MFPYGINRTEVCKQRSKQDKSAIFEKSNSEVKVFVGTNWLVRVDYKGNQAEDCKMQDKGCAPALLEKHKQPDKKIDEPDKPEVGVVIRPFWNRIETVNVREI